jgi:quercetin dioxygenase-like cupin family protein
MTPRTYFRLAGFAAFVVLAAALTPFGYKALAQGGAMARGAAMPAAAEVPMASVNDPPGLPPDPTHIVVTLPDQIKWTGNEALLYGTPNKPGDPYGLLVKLSPGQFSAPHALANDRWVFVVSGTLWVGSGAGFDPKSTYPVTANNFITNLAKTVFWDGNRAGATEPTTLFISGVGSTDNRIMGEYSRKVAVSVNDPAGPAPDTSHITIAAISTTGNANLYGGGQQSTTEGKPYGVIQTWAPGRSSSPHYHPHARYIYVLQGTWWISSSTIHDLRLTYPVPAGSIVEDIPHGIHWDGNRVDADYTTRLYIMGVAPATSHGVDVYGNDLPPRATTGGPGAPRPGR